MGKVENLINVLTVRTKKGELSWRMTSNLFSYSVILDDDLYTIEISPSGKGGDRISLFFWDKDCNPVEIASSDNIEISAKIGTMWEAVKQSDGAIFARVNQYARAAGECGKQDCEPVNLRKLMSRLPSDTGQRGGRIGIKAHEPQFFYYVLDGDRRTSDYVEPPMSQIATVDGATALGNAQVVLISAPGATGKSAMADYLSHKLEIPVFNLGSHQAVGADSISGLIMNQIVREDIFKYHGGLFSGKHSMIIDGLDEASIKITQDSFEAFLQDIASVAVDAVGLPFVILGRPATMEEAALVLEEKGVKTALLQIEPFTIEKAKQFVTYQLQRTNVQKHSDIYSQLLDYLIGQIGGFFRNESELNRIQFERFIGYAPVLQSVAEFLKNEGANYQHILDSLKEDKKSKIDLLLDIVVRILDRETSKIKDEVLSTLVEGARPAEFKKILYEKAGGRDEQCRRILALLMEKDAVINITDDRDFNCRYNEKMSLWIKSHPFVSNGRRGICNIVFESYLVSSLIRQPDCVQDVLSYLSKSGSASYLLLDMYSAMVGENCRRVDYRFFPYLYTSFKALDRQHDLGVTEVLADENAGDQENVVCSLSFGREGTDKECDFEFVLTDDQRLSLPSPVSSLYIDAPINVVLSSPRTDVRPPVSIICEKLRITSRDLVLSSLENDRGEVMLDCAAFEARTSDGNVPQLTDKIKSARGSNGFSLSTETVLGFPFVDYRASRCENLGAGDTGETFQKLRRMLLMFRSHSRGGLARCCAKIDSRIGKSPLGKSLIKGLVDGGVLRRDNAMYYIDGRRFEEVLGVKYDDIRSSVVTEKTRVFLQKSVKGVL